MLIHDLEKKGLIHPPKWLADNCCYLTIMGSVAYSVSSDTSDTDLYGCAIPPKNIIFPHLNGWIKDFDTDERGYDDPWQQHHIKDESARKEYDFAVYGIVRYFKLAFVESNPNLVDSLYTPDNCVIHSTSIGTQIREKRSLALHKRCWPRLKGYAYQQMHKMSSKNPEPGSKRAKDIEAHGYDTKFSYHIYRLLDQAEQILTTRDLDLGRAKEQMKAIRRGEMSEADLRKWATEKEMQLEKIYAESTLPWGPDIPKIKAFLLECLEHHYGSLDKAIVVPGLADQILQEIGIAIDRYRKVAT